MTIPICDVRIYPKHGWDLYDIWFIQYRFDRTAVTYYPDGSTREANEGEDMNPPSITLSRQTLESLVKEAKGSYPPSDQMCDHLQDAIKTRDRLLAVVERVIK